MAACEEARAEFAAEIFILFSQRCLVCACAKGHFVCASEGVCGDAVPCAGKLQSVQAQADFGCCVGADFNSLFSLRRKERQNAVDAGLAALDCRRI
jgi:hypothetical protein